MDAKQLVKETLQNSFDKERFIYFAKNLLNTIDKSKAFHTRGYVPEIFKSYIKTYERIGTYTDPEGKKVDILIVYLQKESTLDRARTAQRNFIARYLKDRGEKDAGLIAFVSPNKEEWRFSFVKMEYKLTETPKGTIKAKEEFTPARRYSFLVGSSESSHTAQCQLVPILSDDKNYPELDALEEAFRIEKVTKEFFGKYRGLFLNLKESLDGLVKKDNKIRKDFKAKDVDTVDFSKKLLGQIVFLYFLQKKGWFGVERDADWGTGPKNFLRQLFEKKIANYDNFFNDILEPLFYEALAIERSDNFYSRFNCKIPFLNGGLFDPINNYDWVHTDIILPDELFSNNIKTKEGDIGTGILDVFDRYNFTVKEDEPLEKEVAVDPEMLGKVFENLLEIKDRKSKGTYYTPREIVHYMCQESLNNYLATELEGKVNKEDIETLIKYGETAVEHDSRVINAGRETSKYSFKLPESVRKHAKLIDEKLVSIRVCDPAVGSGAFPVGMMNEIVRMQNALTNYIEEKDGRSIYNFKRHAIQNCLYGVDIDFSAVEIAKLRLWLSLIVDEEDIKRIKPLPNLDYKIVQGNSLFGFPYTPQGLEQIEQLKWQFFEETRPKIKEQLKNKINTAIRNLLSNTEKSLGYKVDFDFKIFFSEVFHEKKGFDIALGNPPYISFYSRQSRLDEYRKQVNVLRKTYKFTNKAIPGRLNSVMFFLEKSLAILRKGGVTTFIIDANFHEAAYKTIREYILKNSQIFYFIDKFSTFENVTSDQVVLALINRTPRENHKFLYIKSFHTLEKKKNIPQQILLNNNSCSFYTSDFSIRLPINTAPLIELYDTVTGVQIGIGGPREYKGALIKDLFYSNRKNNKRYYPLISLGSKDFYKFCNIKFNGFLNFDIKLGYKINKEVPKCNIAIPKYTDYISVPKIIVRQSSPEVVASYTEKESIAEYSTFSIKAKNSNYSLKFLLALLNSKFVTFYSLKNDIIKVGVKKQPQIRINGLNSIPIKKVPQNEQKPFIHLVDKILSITKNCPGKSLHQTKISQYQSQIDQMVYKLYGLTDDEIKIVENFKK